MLRLFGLRSRSAKTPKPSAKRGLYFEPLESRTVFSGYSVLNLNDAGAGSLRQVILDSNAHAGPDVISFEIAGTIELTSGALPDITDEVDINGASAPGYTSAPVVEIDFNDFDGLEYLFGASGSTLQSLALVNSGTAGVLLNDVDNMTIASNYVGLDLNGTAAGNAGSGIAIIGGQQNSIRSNTISGNSGNGLQIAGGSTQNVVQDNLIGLNVAGDAIVANGLDGIRIENSSDNLIGSDETTTFELSNVISGNADNGIGLYGATNITVAMNYIGTDITGMVDLGNATNGVIITDGSTENLIGGVATGGNSPTNGVFVRPPQGNLISGNDAHGVLITGEASYNKLSGNFIGTDQTGNAALGNALDGVAIANADFNALLGCTFLTDPFVFYNVISGNQGNGLSVIDSDDTTIQANFFGMGANNAMAVANAGNGVLVGGNSTRTVMGGPIPLGNVVAANAMNGIYVKDTASFFTTYNTFCGLAAFSEDLQFGNGLDGMLITTTGGNILIRTNVITRNGDDGIEVSGDARDVRIAGNIVGLDTNGEVAMGNADNGIEISGNAHDIIVGGPQPTFNVIPQNTISANDGNGVAILGNAHDIIVSHSYIGTDVFGNVELGNAKAGVLLGPGTYSNKVGSMDPSLLTIISGNEGNGVELVSTRYNEVIGTYIGLGRDGIPDLGNTGNGVYIEDSYENLIGIRTDFVSSRQFISSRLEFGTASIGAANTIAFNDADGVEVASGEGNAILRNSIYDNGSFAVDLEPGANMNIQSPVITSVESLPFGIRVSGSITTWPSSSFVIEFFASRQDTPEGQNFLGSRRVQTDASGFASFEFEGDSPPEDAEFITATVTDALYNTSEFSLAVD